MRQGDPSASQRPAPNDAAAQTNGGRPRRPCACGLGRPGRRADRRRPVPPHTLVVLGDNRPVSWDSRHYGYVPRHRIVGVMLCRLSAQ
ncbi:S26 family signal peptidase [Actinomadura sp. NPDC049753]|uniref:S26 family signal peptidase n=1 Tax=Actinomadura sp. NPDC049753 TaxID=3154739 RepID=UPI00343FCDBA